MTYSDTAKCQFEKLDPADHNSALVEGQCILAGQHVVGLSPWPEVVQ